MSTIRLGAGLALDSPASSYRLGAEPPAPRPRISGACSAWHTLASAREKAQAKRGTMGVV